MCPREDDDVNDDFDDEYDEYYYRRQHEWTLASFLAFFLVVFIRYAIPNGATMFAFGEPTLPMPTSHTPDGCLCPLRGRQKR